VIENELKRNIMQTAVRTQEFCATNVQRQNTQTPKRLSKFALWRRENPNGILEYVDWRVANR